MSMRLRIVTVIPLSNGKLAILGIIDHRTEQRLEKIWELETDIITAYIAVIIQDWIHSAVEPSESELSMKES